MLMLIYLFWNVCVGLSMGDFLLVMGWFRSKIYVRVRVLEMLICF